MHRVEARWLVVAALALGVVLSVATWNQFEPFTADSWAYTYGAKSLLEGRGFVGITDQPILNYPLGYPLVLAFGRVLSDNAELVGRLVSLLVSTASILLLYLIGKRMLPARQAAAASALAALIPLRVKTSTMVWTEATYLFMVLVAVLLLWLWYERKTPVWALLTGLALGGCYLVRHEGMGLLPIALVVACFMGLPRARLAGGVALILAGFAVMALPYVTYMHSLTGQWRVSYKGDAVLRVSAAMDEDASGLTLVQLDEDSEIVKTEPTLAPKALAGRILRNERIMFERLARLVTPALFGFVGVGLVLLVGKPEHRALSVGTMLLLGAPLAFVAPFHVDDRMLLNVCALGAVLGVAGIAGATQLLGESQRLRGQVVVGALVVIALLDGNFSYNNLGRAPQPRGDRVVGTWIAEHYPEMEAMLVPQAAVGHWAHKLPRRLPDAPLEEIVRHARLKGIRLMVLPKKRHNPSVCAYASAPEDTDDLEVVHTWANCTLVRLKD